MRSVEKIKNIKGKVVLLRADFNVPMKDGKVEDDFRIQKALPTIKLLQKKGAKLVLISHLGRGGETLRGVAEALNQFVKVKFVPDIIGDDAEKVIKTMNDGDIILLENLRNDPGEKEGNNIFAISLSKNAEIYVNEAFPVSHREDASIVLLPKILPGYVGLQLAEEIKNLSHYLNGPNSTKAK